MTAPDQPLTGRLLVATPALGDPNFANTVVLILEHSEDGALGVVLNRPTDTPVEAAVPAWAPLAASPGVVFVGGPVQQDGMVGLGRGALATSDPPEGLGDVGVVDLAGDPEPGVAEVRVFVGYAGWGASQLDGELEAGGWFTVDAHPDDVFTDEPPGLWRSVLERQGGIFRTVPEDPSLN
jgi:putative transcriptional regulator